MPISKHTDPHCMNCRGVGSTIENEKVDEDGGYWCLFVDCYCIDERRSAASRTDAGGV